MMKKNWYFVLTKLALWMIPFVAFGKGKEHVNLIFIGNSITQGALLDDPRHDAPPVRAAFYLRSQGGCTTVRYTNQGISGSTTYDFLPADTTLFPRVATAIEQFRGEEWVTLVFSIMLGTNDSASTTTNGAPVSPAQYRQNLHTIIDHLLALCPTCRIVLHRPIWYSPNTWNGARYMKEGLERLSNYYPEIQQLVAEYTTRFPGQIYIGDIDGFDIFQARHKELMNAEEGHAGTFYLHPNKQGAKLLGELWGKAIQQALEESEAMLNY